MLFLLRKFETVGSRELAGRISGVERYADTLTFAPRGLRDRDADTIVDYDAALAAAALASFKGADTQFDAWSVRRPPACLRLDRSGGVGSSVAMASIQSKSVVVYTSDVEALAVDVAALLRFRHGQIAERAFPDGETYLCCDMDLRGAAVVLVTRLDQPNTRLIRALFVADLCRDLGAASVDLIAPYLPYMRQDERFREGEAVTAKSMGRLISAAFDGLVTADPHLHRIANLDHVLTIPHHIARTSVEVAAWIEEHVDSPSIVGPDSESAQWAEPVAHALGVPYTVLSKLRTGDRDVQVSALEDGFDTSRNAVVVDDIVSTGRTLVEAVRSLHTAGVKSVICVAVHAVCSDPVESALREVGCSRLVTCDTIPHETNQISSVHALTRAYVALINNRRPAP